MLVFLTGLGTLMASVVLRTAKPPKINSVYGYRTKRSKRNQTLWKAAQKYSAKIFSVVGILNIIIGVFLMFVTYSNEYYLFVELGWTAFSFLPVFILTERKLIQIERSDL